MKPSNSECISFLERLGPFDYAITINLKKWHPTYKAYINNEIADKTAKWFYRAINKKIFKRQFRYNYRCINGIYSVEIGDLEKRHHIHMALGKPTHISNIEFSEKLKHVYQKMDWKHGEIHLTQYHNNHWIKYLMKEGFEKVGLF